MEEKRTGTAKFTKPTLAGRGHPPHTGAPVRSCSLRTRAVASQRMLIAQVRRAVFLHGGFILLAACGPTSSGPPQVFATGGTPGSGGEVAFAGGQAGVGGLGGSGGGLGG